jgi:archaemetzincin
MQQRTQTAIILAAFSILLLLSCLFFSCGSQSNTEIRMPVIGLQPYGNFDTSLTSQLAGDIEEFYDLSVYILDPVDLPDYAFINVKSPRYRADSLLKHLKKIRPDTIDFILGLTSKDISTTKRELTGTIKEPASKYEDFGIFGLGYCPGQACVVSTFRYKNVSQEHFYRRFLKICIHELGHNFGLTHCPMPNCLMNDANETIQTIDDANFFHCEHCQRKLLKKLRISVKQ